MPSSNPPPTYKAPNKPHSPMKWLVIILLALIIFGVLLAVLLKNNKSDSDPMDDGLTSNTEAKSSVTAADLQNENQPLATISESDSESELADGKEGLENKETETTEKSSEPEGEESANAADDDKQQLKAESQKQSANQTSSANDNLNIAEATESSNNQQQQNNYPAFDNSIYVAQPQINPNDQVLLPIDLPKAEQNLRVQNESYADTAEQTEDLNEKLSGLINEVKEQKLQQIETQQKASREAYLASRGVSAESSSTSDSSKTRTTESEVETEESVTNPSSMTDAP